MANNVRLFFGSKSVSVVTEAIVHEHTMTEAWIANAETQYNAMMAVMAEISASGVPFFISTDQHGRTLTQHCWFAHFAPLNMTLTIHTPEHGFLWLLLKCSIHFPAITVYK